MADANEPKAPAAAADEEPQTDGPISRRHFMVACGIGCGAVAAAAVPALQLVAATRKRTTVTTPTTPLDIGSIDAFASAAGPRRVEVIAPLVRDGWVAQSQVVLGAAWITRSGDRFAALSAVCPHLGCAIGWDAKRGQFLCPCHESYFEPNGERLNGPSPRGMDPLPIAVVDGRLQLRWVQYAQGISERKPV